MADEIRPSRVGPRRVSRTTTTGGKKSSKTGRSPRTAGLKAVDTIPRLEEQDFEDGESKGLERLLAAGNQEEFTSGGFVDDLKRALTFLQELPADPSMAGGRSELHEQCTRILMEEVSKAREMAALRKGAPRA